MGLGRPLLAGEASFPFSVIDGLDLQVMEVMMRAGCIKIRLDLASLGIDQIFLNIFKYV